MAKILVIKPKPGSYKLIFNKLTTINKKNGPFDLILCVSDLFKVPENPQEIEELDDLLGNKIVVPVRTFAMIGKFDLPDLILDRLQNKNGLVCNNLEILAPNSILTLSTIANLRIANFGGVYDPSTYSGEGPDTQTNYIRSDQLTKFINKLKPTTTTQETTEIDILLSHSIPESITNNSKLKPKENGWEGCGPMTEVLKTSKPRYHFAGGTVHQFWEREPWLWESDQVPSKHSDYPKLTRFVNLAEFGNQAKERWFYAFNIVSTHELKPTLPVNLTPSPYALTPQTTRSSHQKRDFGTANQDGFEDGPNFRFGDIEPNKKKNRTAGPPPPNYLCKICSKSGHWIQECPDKIQKSNQPKEGYVCRICNTPGHLIQDCPDAATNNNQRNRAFKDFSQPKEIGPDSCWFCLSNPQVAKHLIASIGSETYLTLPKGQLPDTTNNCPIPGGGHVLLIPIAHYPSLLGLPSELAIPIVSEIEQYKSAIKRCYEAYSASMVSFEVAKLSGRGARAGHAHLQICPVPNHLADQVEKTFIEHGHSLGIDLVDEIALKDMKDQVKDAISYFRVGLPDGKNLVHLMKPDEKFNLQFGRITLANLLGTPDRVNWKSCERSETEEKLDCKSFQKAFAAFEPKF
ncbi:hypothetical protein MJO28_009276 [Puccinia striiformis f. sp. tritici]|uniref:Uncharacterized protein n=1 Tax=Puccinia striiformis f. sp. tritici TaxID=168172 RepID=A0ACC0E7C7_9BASI|nr:hypothetical protein MJO28_009276 [Puccinia striiformis f. sp. tritici]